VDADLGQDGSVDGEVGGDVDVGVVECGEFLFPVGGFEVSEEGAE
jgi:hypothetical protein